MAVAVGGEVAVSDGGVDEGVEDVITAEGVSRCGGFKNTFR